MLRIFGSRDHVGTPAISFSLLMLALCVSGCARSQYRQAADQEAYRLIQSRQTDTLWSLPDQAVEPAPHSRMYLAAEQDCGPKPEDDLAANCYMQRPNGINNRRYYGKIPNKVSTENPAWIDYLPRTENGQINLTQPLAMDLALLHSREYQSNFENVYLAALDLSGNRFEFDAQWFGGLGATFAADGEDLGNTRQLDATASRLGFTRNLAGGGQFATSMLNSLVWDFGTSTLHAGSGSLVSTFTQPLLRGAFRHVRLESLTQSERDLLYTVRDFARFRRTFYVDISTAYLGLVTQVQAVRNLKTNVANLQRNLDEHAEYVRLGMVSQVQRDQVFQQYQNGRRSLLAAEQNLTASLDAFKFRLGIPPWVPLEIDESMLTPFELVDSQIVELRDAADDLYRSLVDYLPPAKAPRDFLIKVFDDYTQMRDIASQLIPGVEDELVEWQTRLDAVDVDALGTDDAIDHEQQLRLAEQVRVSLADVKLRLENRNVDSVELRNQIELYDQAPVPPPAPNTPPPAPNPQRLPAEEPDFADGDELPVPSLVEAPEILAWREMGNAVDEKLREEIGQLFVAQTQIRLFLIDIESFSVNQHNAITYAHYRRLDLMNSKAQVMDAFRRVEVAADSLQSDLTLTGSASLATDTARNNAYRFDANNNRYTVGVEFDGPLNRLNERNGYRAAQISYQRSTRQFMSDKDRIANEVRAILRQLQLARLNFQISRQQLVATTRQVDQAQIELRNSTTLTGNLTLLLLEALEGLLNSKNSLISDWINYRVQKMRLFEALEMLYLDSQGNWINEESGLAEFLQFDLVDGEYFPPDWVSPESMEVDDIAPAEPSVQPTEQPEDGESVELSAWPRPHLR